MRIKSISTLKFFTINLAVQAQDRKQTNSRIGTLACKSTTIIFISAVNTKWSHLWQKIVIIKFVSVNHHHHHHYQRQDICIKESTFPVTIHLWKIYNLPDFEVFQIQNMATKHLNMFFFV